MKGEILNDGRSLRGRRVTLSRECGTYFGAQPYFTLTRWRKKGDRQDQERYTPLRHRADAIYRAFLRDETDPQKVAAAR